MSILTIAAIVEIVAENLGEADVLLTGRARAQEIILERLAHGDQKLMLEATQDEWSKWHESKSIKPLTQKMLDYIYSFSILFQIVVRRWVLTKGYRQYTSTWRNWSCA